VKHEKERKELKRRRKKIVVKRHTAFVTGEQIIFFSAVMVLGRCPLVLLAENSA